MAQKKKKVDTSSFIPKEWSLPKELAFLSEVNLHNSESPAINICDAIIRKANVLNQTFRGSRQPEYVSRNSAMKEGKLPCISKSRKIIIPGLLNVASEDDMVVMNN